jgi:hypothetical protein
MLWGVWANMCHFCVCLRVWCAACCGAPPCGLRGGAGRRRVVCVCVVLCGRVFGLRGAAGVGAGVWCGLRRRVVWCV